MPIETPLYQIGIKRITAIVGLMNLTYNMFRKIQLTAPLAGQVCPFVKYKGYKFLIIKYLHNVKLMIYKTMLLLFLSVLL